MKKGGVTAETTVVAGGGSRVACFDPCTGGALGEVAADSKEDVEGKVASCRAAQAEWSRTSFAERRRVLRMMMEVVLGQADEICKISSVDTGKTRVDAMFGEIMVTCEKIAWVCANGERALAPESRGTGLLTVHKTAWVEYAPVGVLGVIAPWNYPFHNMYNHIVSGLFAGNGVVIKMSEYSAASGERFLRLAQEVLLAAGHSPDLVQVVQGHAATGDALVRSGVDKIVFTGSPQVGKIIARSAADRLTPCVLELGGKDPMIVTEDADLDQVVHIAVRGALQNAGQNCIGVERFYVYDSVYDAFVDRVAAVVRALRQGPPVDADGRWVDDVDVGGMTMPSSLALIQKLVDDAVRKGARLVVGGKVNADAARKFGGLFFQPTVLADVTHDMDIANHEVFGPIVTILRVPHDSDADAVRMANSTEYGLGASVFARDVARAERIAHKINAGMVNVNDFGLNYMVQSLPFGGVRISGYDRFAGVEGLRACCHIKSLVSDLLPGIRTALPKPAQYPMSASSFRFVHGLIHLLYDPSVAGRLRAIADLIAAQ
jgi:acyl-CoA reductase-like NAD-dependent aldehyde dehydrogenase